MIDISELRFSVNKFLNWNKARVDCLVRLVLALLTVQTVNLRSIATAFASSAQIDSRYRRLQNFFARFKMDYTALARWLFRLFFTEGETCYLSLDRTNWQWGQRTINVLVLAAVYEGMAIPLFWKALDHGGSSSVADRQALVRQFIDTFGVACMAGLLADREFVGKTWISWLTEQNVPFYIRINDNLLTTNHKGQPIKLHYLFKHLNPKQKATYAQAYSVYGQLLYLAGARSEKGELVIIATNQHPDHALETYYQRWGIENLFQSLKSRGFCFESTHMTDLARIEKLMGVLTIAFCWAHRTGEWQAEKRPIRLIWHEQSNEYRPQYSYFRYGLDWIKNLLYKSKRKVSDLKAFFRQLIMPASEMEAII
jgi:uncharacterized membrane protein